MVLCTNPFCDVLNLYLENIFDDIYEIVVRKQNLLDFILNLLRSLFLDSSKDNLLMVTDRNEGMHYWLFFNISWLHS